MKLKVVALFLVVALYGVAEPVRVIFDTDMGNDTDDLIALCMLHTLKSRGVVDVLAITVTKDHALAAPLVDAVNTFYGSPAVPIGVVKGGATPEQGKFLELVESRNQDGTLRYPHTLMSGADAPDATALLRKTLAGQPDKSVVLVQVGFFTNFIRLFESGADESSELSGRELIEKKVRLLAVMAGAFQTIDWNNQYREYNVCCDIPSAQKLAKEWQTPIVWCGFEIGIAACYPYASVEHDFGYVAHHPLPEAYNLYSPKGHERPLWDPATLLYAVYPERGYFDLSPAGRVEVLDNGATIFAPGKDGQGRDRYLKMSAEQAARVREAIAQLAVAPPVR